MQRPTSVTVFGVLSLVFAAFAGFGAIAGIFISFLPGSEHNPALALMRDDAGYAAWYWISIGLGFVGAIILAASGIGLLKLLAWGRKLSVGYAIFSIVMVVVSGFMNYYYLIGPMMEQSSQAQGPEAAAAIGGIVGAAFGACFGLLFPILTLIFMTRPKVVAAFKPAPATPDPAQA